MLTAPLGAVQQPAILAYRLSTVRFPISCDSSIQPVFNRAVALLHSFAFGEATTGFKEVLAGDPDCAIAEWGIALSAWGNPFAPGIKPGELTRRGQAALGCIDAVALLHERADSVDQQAGEFLRRSLKQPE